MDKAIISAIAAIGPKGELGKDNKLLWKLPSDFNRFRKKTRGHPVIMGRKTFDSIIGYGGKPLVDRLNIVITRDKSLKFDGVVFTDDIVSAIDIARQHDQDEVFIIGGEQIYKLAMPYTDKLYLTHVEGDFDADAFFPSYSEFVPIYSEGPHHENGFEYKYIDYVRH